jgi:CMP-N-acetylneuraminic acid synthetase
MTARVLAVVPARSGSKGIPGKNERSLGGRTLIQRCADAARESGVVDRICLSTDSEAIAELGHRAGIEVPFVRPPNLATDETPMQPVIEHAVREIERGGWQPDVVLVLQPTAPLRTGAHLRRATELLVGENASSVVSVVEIPRHYSPEYAMRLDEGRLVPFLAEGAYITRRQDATPAYSRDGTVYAVRRDVVVLEHDLYGPDCRALVLEHAESLNLDTEADWQAAEQRV